MYYPESKIVKNLYTNGEELVYVSTEAPYSGAYHILANGEIYTGKNPRDGEFQNLSIIILNSYQQTQIEQWIYLELPY
jgi:hypothetical protein